MKKVISGIVFFLALCFNSGEFEMICTEFYKLNSNIFQRKSNLLMFYIGT